MGREQLLDVTARMIAWINTAQADAGALATICTSDIAVPIPYPGSTADFAGLVDVTGRSHTAFPDFKMAIKDQIVDEKESRVVLQLNVSGTQAGYDRPENVSDNREWLGIPPSGKKFDTQGFMYAKVTRLCRHADCRLIPNLG